MKLWSGLFLAVACSTLNAQQVSTPDLSSSHLSPTLYFPSPLAESHSRTVFNAPVPTVVKELQDSSPASLPDALAHAEQLVTALQTHAAFLRARTLEDTTDQEAKRARLQVNTNRSIVEEAEESRLRLNPPREIPALGKYAFLAQSVQKNSAHLLSPDMERYRGMVVSPELQAIADDYDRINATLKCPQAVSSTDTTMRRASITECNHEFDQARTGRPAAASRCI